MPDQVRPTGREPRVTMRQLSEQVAELAALVRALTTRELAVTEIRQDGFAAGQAEARAERPRGRANHLHAVQAQ